jgi:hypothetical protein
MKAVPSVDDVVVLNSSPEAVLFRIAEIKGHRVRLECDDIPASNDAGWLDHSAVSFPSIKQLNRS